MGNIILIIVGLLVGVGIAYFIASDFSATWGNLPCILGLILLLFMGQEFFRPSHQEAGPRRSWNYSRRHDDETDRDT